LLAAQDARASASVVRAYAPVYRQLQNNTQALVKVAQTRGLKPWQVMRMQRMKDLEQEFLASASKFADIAGSRITDSQRAAVGLARRGAEQTVVAGLPRGVTMENLANIGLGWNRLPEEAFTNFVGIAADGNPVSNLLAPLGREAAGGVKDAIGTGIALGKGPRQTAQLVRVAAGMPLSKALLITRTETNRAFREATRLDYANNSQVVKGYRRLAAHSERTCMACIALDGTLYALDEPLNEHPNGRCALVPDTITYQDLGLDVEMPPQPENARDWLTRQPEVTQRKMLGDVRFEAVKRGELQLNQLATVRQNAVWGDAAVVRPIKDLGLGKGGPTGVAVTPPPIPGVPVTPLRPPTELLDPKTGARVRGSRQAPPEPTLPEGWVGDPDDFLDVSSDIGRGRVKQQINEQVREQEAWARAVHGAVEVDYQGLSIRAAEQVNKAVEVTIVRNRWRPLDIITTKRREGRGGAFGRAYAYQSGNGVHINATSSSRLTGAGRRLERGSVRAWDRNNLVDNAHVKKRHLEGPERVANLEAELENKRRIYAEWKRKGDIDALIVDPELVAKGVQPMRFSVYNTWISRYEEAVKKAKLQMQKSAAERFHPTTGGEFLKEVVTHEIGHYGHRRWGMVERRSRNLLQGKSAKDEARLLSEYAMKNDREFFAEAFTEHIWLGGERNSPAVTQFIQDVIKANTDFADKEGFSIGGLMKSGKGGGG